MTQGQNSTSQAPQSGITRMPDENITWGDPTRRNCFEQWFDSIQHSHGLQTDSLRLASADASFRRYFRVDRSSADAKNSAPSFIIMDAPPEKEDCKPFVHIAQLMQQAGLVAPEVLEWDERQGFMLLTDLGSQTMMQAIDPLEAPPLDLYMQAVDTLVQWQLSSRPGVLPLYDRALLTRELELFPQWYMGPHRQLCIDANMRKTLDDAFTCIIQNNLSWPSVYVHRDFMPRNLMVSLQGQNLGVLDFQDAVYGPVTYDIASLMRDAFLSWDEEFCLDVTIRYWEKARKAGLPVGDDFGEFYRGVEWMGLQRHLKVAGIFARLTLRDGKPKYLADTPRFIHYMYSTCNRYRELKPLQRLIEKMENIAVPGVYTFGRA